jgi:hypothetical protein
MVKPVRRFGAQGIKGGAGKKEHPGPRGADRDAFFSNFRSDVEREIEVAVVEGTMIMVRVHQMEIVDRVRAAIDAHLVPVAMPILGDDPHLVVEIVVVVVTDDMDI